MSSPKYQDILKYTSLGTQLTVGLAIFAYGGNWIDKHVHFSKPIFTWVLPLFFLLGILIKLIIETNKKKNVEK